MTIDEALKRLDDYDYTQRGVLEDVYQQGRADAIDEVMEKYVEVVCEDCSKCGGHCRHDEVMNMLKQLKEQNDDN